MTNSNDAHRNQSGSERSPVSTDDQPDTAAHTITGDGTIPADATVQTRDSEIADTVKDDADSHACEGCGQTFEEIGRLLDHDCEGDWDGPDPDDDGRRALADGGAIVDISPEEFQRRLNQCSTTDREEKKRCEECGGTSLEPKNPTDVDAKREHPEPYRCGNCGEHVEGTDPEARTDGGVVKELEDVDTRAIPAREYERMPQLRRDLLATIAELHAERETVRYQTVREAFAERHDMALPEQTFEQHVTMLAHDGLVERGGYSGLDTTIAPTDAALEVIDDA